MIDIRPPALWRGDFVTIVNFTNPGKPWNKRRNKFVILVKAASILAEKEEVI